MRGNKWLNWKTVEELEPAAENSARCVLTFAVEWRAAADHRGATAGKLKPENRHQAGAVLAIVDDAARRSSPAFASNRYRQ